MNLSGNCKQDSYRQCPVPAPRHVGSARAYSLADLAAAASDSADGLGGSVLLHIAHVHGQGDHVHAALSFSMGERSMLRAHSIKNRDSAILACFLFAFVLGAVNHLWCTVLLRHARVCKEYLLYILITSRLNEADWDIAINDSLLYVW